jgi:hypothetical protein
MDDRDSAPRPTVIRSQAGVLWRPAAAYVFATFVLAVAIVWDQSGPTRSDVVAGLAIWLGAASILCAMTILPWWWNAGRTVYEARIGMLVVTGRRAPQRVIAAEDIHGLWVTAEPTWMGLLTPWNLVSGFFPRVEIWTGERELLEPILVWGPGSSALVERKLRTALGLD